MRKSTEILKDLTKSISDFVSYDIAKRLVKLNKLSSDDISYACRIPKNDIEKIKASPLDDDNI